MRFAITHPILGHPYDPELVSGRGIALVAEAAEAAGFHGYGFTDHPAPSQRWLDSGGHDALDPFVAMAFAAASTSLLRLVPNIVVLPYRNPLIVAKAGATLDRLSAGRFTLAVGAGYLRREFTALGVDYERRNELFNESLEVIRTVWTEDDVTYEGHDFTASGITAHPRPFSVPHPPIWIGGNAALARQRVADYGDGWCPSNVPQALAKTTATVPMDTLDRLAEGIEDVKKRLKATGRDPSSLDVSFPNHAGGSPADPGFDVEAHVSNLEALGQIGVTWTQVSLPTDSLEHVLTTIERYGTLVLDHLPDDEGSGSGA